MADLALMSVQLRGKLRRFVQSNVVGEDPQALLARRQGDCNRCGACCKILFRCPFLGTDADGSYTCRIYEKRFSQCRLFPLHPQDLREVSECSYTFVEEPRRVLGTPLTAQE
jgi:Fe-S-cluster containining protein